MKNARYALRKSPDNLTENQHVKLEWTAKTSPTLHRAYLLKEDLRVVFQLPYDGAVEALERWISWARRCRIPAFVRLQHSIVKHRARILAAIEHHLSNGLSSRPIPHHPRRVRIPFPEPLIALAMLTLSGHQPGLPGRK